MRKLRLLAVPLVLLAFVGCAQVTSLKDGFIGTPINQAGGDIPAWYHIGEALNPFVHALIAILRSVLGL
jgi:hypothetical protein